MWPRCRKSNLVSSSAGRKFKLQAPFTALLARKPQSLGTCNQTWAGDETNLSWKKEDRENEFWVFHVQKTALNATHKSVPPSFHSGICFLSHSFIQPSWNLLIQIPCSLNFQKENRLHHLLSGASCRLKANADSSASTAEHTTKSESNPKPLNLLGFFSSC